MNATAKPSPLLGRFLVLCAVIFMSLPCSLRSEEALKEQSDLNATEPGPLEAAIQHSARSKWRWAKSDMQSRR